MTWGIPKGVQRGRIGYNRHRDIDAAQKRLTHMIELYDKGEKISNIARLYRISRQRVHHLLKQHIASK